MKLRGGSKDLRISFSAFFWVETNGFSYALFRPAISPATKKDVRARPRKERKDRDRFVPVSFTRWAPTQGMNESWGRPFAFFGSGNGPPTFTGHGGTSLVYIWK